MTDIHLKGLLPESYHSLFWDLYEGQHEEYWLAGGRGSGKSSFVSLALLCLMLKDPEMNVMIYRKVADSLRESVYGQMRWAVERLGLRGFFQERLSPLEMIYRPTGQRILFKGADDPEKSKGVKLNRGYFGALWFEEAAAFRGMGELRTIQASILRGKQGVTLLSYNPPVSARNWVNGESAAPREGRLTHRSDYRQLPPEWLGPTFLKQAEQLRVQDERAYRHMYLGEAVGTGGMVFGNVVLRQIGREEEARLPYGYAGLDFGFANDPDALVLCRYDRRSRRLYLCGERVRTGQSLRALAEECRELAGERVIRCDSAAPREIAELRRAGVQAVGARKGPRRCPRAGREFSLYEYSRDREGAFVNECPDRDNHTIDAVRYALEPLMTEQVVKLKKGGIY